MNGVSDASKVMTKMNKPILTKEFVEKVKDRKDIDIKKTEVKESSYIIETEEDVERFKELLDVSNEVLFGKDSHYELSVHKKTGTIMSKLVNTDTGEIMKEFPPEKILDMIAGLWEIAGIIVDEQA
ncbi:MAG: flagellar protein FlaG [Bacillota bacterium]|nr:flagellar protein FlaG [Bacillota bacterium]